jgi:hypothetical protein
MSADSMTLREFLNLEEEVPKHAEKMRSVLAAGKENIQLTTIPWPKLEEKVLENLSAFFDLKIVDLCTGAWKKYEELREFADLKKHKKTEENEVALLEHEIISTHQPRLEFSIGTIKKTIVFDLEISLKLEGADLTIQGGCITKVCLGKCHGEGSLALAKTELLNLKSKEIPFGEAVPLPEPIKIEVA